MYLPKEGVVPVSASVVPVSNKADWDTRTVLPWISMEREHTEGLCDIEPHQMRT